MYVVLLAWMFCECSTSFVRDEREQTQFWAIHYRLMLNAAKMLKKKLNNNNKIKHYFFMTEDRKVCE